MDIEKLGERSVYVDCDVLQADGGTRCAAITGGYVALHLALAKIVESRRSHGTAAHRLGRRTPSGIVDGDALLDLEYIEDSRPRSTQTS